MYMSRGGKVLLFSKGKEGFVYSHEQFMIKSGLRAVVGHLSCLSLSKTSVNLQHHKQNSPIITLT